MTPTAPAESFIDVLDRLLYRGVLLHYGELLRKAKALDGSLTIRIGPTVGVTRSDIERGILFVDPPAPE
ncbi:MAG: hypothetical protein ACRD2J_04835 [Thermoanaerobaculia bacterium]